MGNWDGNKGSPSRLSSGFDEGRRTGNFARTLEGFQALYSVPQGARCKVCEREGVRATGCRVVGAAGRAARKRPNVRAWGALGKGRNLEGKPWKGPPSMDPSIGGGCGTCGCDVGVQPPSFWWREPVRGPVWGGDCCANGKGAISARAGAGPHWSVEGSPWLLAVFSKNRRTRYCTPAPSTRPCPPSLFPSWSPPRTKEWGTGAGTVLDVPPTNPIKPPLRRFCTTHHRATTMPGLEAGHGCRPLGPCPSFHTCEGRNANDKRAQHKKTNPVRVAEFVLGAACLLRTYYVPSPKNIQITSAEYQLLNKHSIPQLMGPIPSMPSHGDPSQSWGRDRLDCNLYSVPTYSLTAVIGCWPVRARHDAEMQLTQQS